MWGHKQQSCHMNACVTFRSWPLGPEYSSAGACGLEKVHLLLWVSACPSIKQEEDRREEGVRYTYSKRVRGGIQMKARLGLVQW